MFCVHLFNVVVVCICIYHIKVVNVRYSLRASVYKAVTTI